MPRTSTASAIATPSKRPVDDTAEMILDSAETFIQTRGYNGFSYADVASELGVTKAALHYHFATKGDLGIALLERYTERFLIALAAADAADLSAAEKIDHYGQLYLSVLQGRRMCLCGMLAAEHETLPAPMRAAVLRFFDRNETWLSGVLDAGRLDGTLRFDGPAGPVAQSIVGDLEGAMLIARLHDDVDRFTSVLDRLLRSLTAAAHD